MPGEWEPSPRDVLIDRVRRGELTPSQAEADALEQGFGPIATKPGRIEFSPNDMPWWSLPMALAWIAWRSLECVQESCAEYRENWLEWFPGSWNIPSGHDDGFTRIDGYELKALRGSTAVRLTFEEAYMRSSRTLPPTTEMTIKEAEEELFRALASGQLIAAAKDKNRNVVEIPQREWPYLKCYEEEQRDVLKHDALEAPAAFTEIKFRRDDLQRLWVEYLIEPHMIEPMTRAGEAGYVPLCSALHWIMTEGGTVVQRLKDDAAWRASTHRLMTLVATGEVEIVGRPRHGGPAEAIKGTMFAGILVPCPLEVAFSVLTGNDPWISCTPYVGDEHWSKDFNDQAFFDRSGGATWAHLQVRKSDILRQISFERAEQNKAVYEAGAPGRPTSMQLVRAEFEVRASTGALERSLTLQAEALAKWLKVAHPKAPQLKAKTIMNHLGPDFRRALSRK